MVAAGAAMAMATTKATGMDITTVTMMAIMVVVTMAAVRPALHLLDLGPVLVKQM
jgi:hypothetical protein